jgi:hypothetical protein
LNEYQKQNLNSDAGWLSEKKEKKTIRASSAWRIEAFKISSLVLIN